MRRPHLFALALLTAAVTASASTRADPPLKTSRAHVQPISLDVQRADVREVLQLIADAARVNLVLADDVTGRVTLKAQHVDWLVALDAVTSAAKLTYRVEGNILWVERAP